MTKVFNVEGMMCNHCTERLTKILNSVSGISDVKTSLEEKTCTVTFDGIDEKIIVEAIEDAGFSVL